MPQSQMAPRPTIHHARPLSAPQAPHNLSQLQGLPTAVRPPGELQRTAPRVRLCGQSRARACQLHGAAGPVHWRPTSPHRSKLHATSKSHTSTRHMSAVSPAHGATTGRPAPPQRARSQPSPASCSLAAHERPRAAGTSLPPHCTITRHALRTRART
mmetsp:Transcript_18947/g.46603  ORF Transcript_18947/g.46603 Transcript_18947/m.46603 type:complete len:157 (+) Transcript_18947:19-489(+)